VDLTRQGVYIQRGRMQQVKSGLTVAQLIRAVEEIAPPELAETWDNVGLQVGDPSAPVRRVMTCLEATPPTLSEAIRRRADALVAHHPLIFRPLEALDLCSPNGALIGRLVRSGLTLIAAHTNLDAAAWSTNSVLAEQLGWEPEGPLSTEQNPRGPGLTVRLLEPMAPDSLASFIKHKLGLDRVRLSGPPRKKVRRVAICTGAGGSLLDRLTGRAEALLTGEVNYHRAIEAAARGITVLEIGHFESEVLVAEPLAEKLARAPTLSAAGVGVFPARKDLQPFRHM